jgi:arylsulfatase
LLAAAGNPDVTKQLLDGCTVDGKKFNVHLDGYNMIPYLTGKVKEVPRPASFTSATMGKVIAGACRRLEIQSGGQRANTMRQWAEPFVKLRLPYIMSMRRDPFERAEYNSNTYMDWMVDHVPQMYMMQAFVAQQIAGFAKFPPRQKPASFNLDAVLAQVSGHGHA